MVRLVAIALLASLPAVAFSKPPVSTAQSDPIRVQQRSFELSDTFTYSDQSSWRIHTEIAPNASFGLGMFGFKGERNVHSKATVREFGTRRTRRAGVGFSLKF